MFTSFLKEHGILVEFLFHFSISDHTKAKINITQKKIIDY